MEKTEDVLRKEIDELQRQQREVPFLSFCPFLSFYSVFDAIFVRNLQITERLRDPRGLRRGGLSSVSGTRNFAANGVRQQRGFVRPVCKFFSLSCSF